MNDATDPIGEALNLQPLQSTVVQTEVLPATMEKGSDSSEQVTQDFEYARGHMIATIEKGQEALSDMLELAGASQQPRAYEVVATLIKTLADANKDLLELTKRKHDLTGEHLAPTTVNNNLFVGSTAELQKLIKKQTDGSN